MYQLIIFNFQGLFLALKRLLP